MNQIVPHSLWISSVGALRDIRRLHELGITAVVQLAYEEAPVALTREFVNCRFPLLDGADTEPETIRLAIHCLTQLLERKFATLVCCHAGMSRSPGIAAAALARMTAQPLVSCLEHIASCRPIQVHLGFFEQLQILCAE
jgi:protein-tyrosine phosphatase